MDDLIPLNGLRGVCAMAIFLGHQTDMFLTSPWREQEVVIGLEYLQAISLFFLLSGIPLARLYSTTRIVHSWEGSCNFWRKRFARLAPIYYLSLVLNVLIILVMCKDINVAALLSSTFGCAFFLQSWFVSLINVGGVLWQIAVFVFFYAFFPFLSRRFAGWSDGHLMGGFGAFWLFSTGLWCAVFAFPTESREWKWWIWHVHCVSRLPHAFAGVFLGELVERAKDDPGRNANSWAVITDIFSLLLLATAIQAPIAQVLYGSVIRIDISIALEALLLPVHAVWLAGIVLSFPLTVESPDSDVGSTSHSIAVTHARRECWTRHFLSLKPIVALGEVSVVIYCLHLVVLFIYTATLAFVHTGDWRVIPAIDNYELSTLAPWWHAPAQWALVTTASFATSRWFEAPLRRLLVGIKPAALFPKTRAVEAAVLLRGARQNASYGTSDVQ